MAEKLVSDHAFEKGLPAALEAERYVIGTMLLDGDNKYRQVADVLDIEDYSLESSRRIHSRIKDLYDRGEGIDRVTVANELKRQGQLESVGGLSYLVSLDKDLPEISNLDAYVRIVKENSALRRIIFSAQKAAHRAISLESSIAVIESLRSDLDHAAKMTAQTSSVPSVAGIVDEVGYHKFLNPIASTRCISTGFKEFDKLTTGLEPGTLTIIAGRTSQGKTSLAMCMAQNIAENGIPVQIFSMEMTSRSLIERMVSATACIDLLKYRSGGCNLVEQGDARTALEKIYALPIHIDDNAVQSVRDISLKLERLKVDKGVEVCFLDYVQLLASATRSENRRMTTEEILTDAIEGLKAIGKRLGIAMVVLSQLSRAPDIRGGDHKPQLSDLRSSGGLEQAADLVVFVFRKSVYLPEREDLKGVAELLIRKQRNGPIGDVNIRFKAAYTLFEDW